MKSCLMLVAIRKNNFDQNRIYTALHHGLNSNITFELGYLNSFRETGQLRISLIAI
jgi:hypothetical protein